jgi:hypothetical protein
MKCSKWTGIVIAVMSLLWAGSGFCVEESYKPAAVSEPSISATADRPASGMPCPPRQQMMRGMKHGMMHRGVHHMMGEKGVGMGMPGMRGCRMHERCMGMAAQQIMAPFHRWLGKLTAHRQDIGLTSEQMDKLDAMVTEHLQFAIVKMAESRALQVQLRHLLRQEPLEMPAVENLLKQITEHDFNLQLEGVKLYNQVLQMLTDQQREKATELIGTPFPPPWENMLMAPGMKMMGQEPSEEEGEANDDR